MKWKKRDCPIRLELVAYGSGWEDVTLEIGGDRHWYSISGCLGDGFGGLVESLYVLYPHQSYNEAEKHRWLTAEDEYVGDYKDGKYFNLRLRTDSDSTYFCFPKRAEFYWDLEGHGVSWTLTRESGAAREFKVTVELEEVDGQEKKSFKYVVDYADLCYAVGRALTEVVKKHGFGGFHESVWESDVNIRYLCFLKACGMGKPDAVMPVKVDEEDDGSVSSFKDEIELLMFDM